MRRLLPVFTLILMAVILGRSSLPPVFGPSGGPIVIDAQPVALDRRDPANDRVGELRFVRGWQLTSPSPGLGGLSGLRAWGGRWVAVMDTGALLFFSPVDRQALIVPVMPRCNPDRVRLGYDLEGIDTDGKHIWVSSEWHDTICRRDPDGAQTGVRPPAMSDWPRSAGAETLLRLRDGRFLIMPEDGVHPALIFPADPVRGGRPRRMTYRPPAGYSPTDAAQLPDGRIVILNRKLGLDGFAATIVLFEALPARGTAQGRVIATLAAPLIHDNFEGISARREDGATILTLVSDNNASRWQPTLLLEFQLPD